MLRKFIWNSINLIHSLKKIHLEPEWKRKFEVLKSLKQIAMPEGTENPSERSKLFKDYYCEVSTATQVTFF